MPKTIKIEGSIKMPKLNLKPEKVKKTKDSDKKEQKK